MPDKTKLRREPVKNKPKPLLLAAIMVVGQVLAFLLSFLLTQLDMGATTLILVFIAPFIASIIYAAIFRKINKQSMWDYFFLHAISYPCVLLVYFYMPGNQVDRIDIAVTGMLILGVIIILPTLPVCAIYTERRRAVPRQSVQTASLLTPIILIPASFFLLIFYMYATADGARMQATMPPPPIESQAVLWQGETQPGISEELASILAVLHGIAPQDVTVEHLAQIGNITIFPDKVTFSRDTILGEQWADAVMRQIDSFSSLNGLFIEDYPNINYEGLIGLDNLGTISISGKNITEIHFPKSKSVTSFYAADTSVSDFENLSAFPNLFSISIADSPVSNLPDLSELENLSSLQIIGGQLKQLPTAYPPEIMNIVITGNQIKSLDGIENLLNNTTVHELNLRENQIEDISAFGKCRQPQDGYLYRLILSDNQISDINSLQNIKIDSLWLERNQISDLTGLSKDSGITYLELGENQISDLSPLSHITSLNNLRARNNNISSVAMLQSLPDLDTLELSGNKIENAEQFVNLERLQILILEDNNITDANPFTQLEELQRICLTGNPITNINKLRRKRGLDVDFEELMT